MKNNVIIFLPEQSLNFLEYEDAMIWGMKHFKNEERNSGKNFFEIDNAEIYI